MRKKKKRGGKTGGPEGARKFSNILGILGGRKLQGSTQRQSLQGKGGKKGEWPDGGGGGIVVR